MFIGFAKKMVNSEQIVSYSGLTDSAGGAHRICMHLTSGLVLEEEFASEATMQNRLAALLISFNVNPD